MGSVGEHVILSVWRQHNRSRDIQVVQGEIEQQRHCKRLEQHAQQHGRRVRLLPALHAAAGGELNDSGSTMAPPLTWRRC
jgi:hypothetical protein